MCNGVNLEKEREVFEQWFVTKYPYTSLDRDKGVVGTYWHERVEMSWQSWLSSASREGYKLVPVENESSITRFSTQGIDLCTVSSTKP